MLTLIIGPMFSGKSTELLKKMNRAVLAKKKTCLIRPHMDTRPHLTHDFTKISPDIDIYIIRNYSFSNQDIPKILEYNTICFDEWQFFPDSCWDNFIFPLLKIIQDKDINCYIAGLSNNFYLKPFNILSLTLPLANRIEVQTAICIQCGKSASYTSLKGAESTDDVVGSSEKYDALCWHCYRKNHP